DPACARAAAGFDYFSIGVPDKDTIDQLADRLTALGEEHAGVHWASIGWILPLLHDPDGHEVRFYTHQHHSEPEPGKVTTIHDPREASERRERATARRPGPGRPAGYPVGRSRGRGTRVVRQQRQVQLPQPVRIRDHVDGGDPAGLADREGQHDPEVTG